MSISSEIERIKKAKESIINTLKANDIHIEETATIDEVDIVMNDVPILDTSDATATAEDILKDKTAYIKGEKVTGTLEVSGSNAIEGSMSSKNDFKLLIKEIDGNVKINTTDAKEFFYGYPNLEIVRSLDTSMVKSMYYMFYNCTNLKYVCVMDWSNIVTSGTADLALNDTFAYCNKLSDESLNNIMASCISATKYKGKKTFSNMGIYNVADRCKNLSNYQAFIDAGWTV